MPQASPPTSRIDYAPGYPVVNSKRLQRSIVLVAFVIAGIFCRRWPESVWQNFRFSQYQRECILHPVPLKTLIYSSGPPVISARSSQCASLYGFLPFKVSAAANQTIASIFVGELHISFVCNVFDSVIRYDGRLQNSGNFVLSETDTWHPVFWPNQPASRP